MPPREARCSFRLPLVQRAFNNPPTCDGFDAFCCLFISNRLLGCGGRQPATSNRLIPPGSRPWLCVPFSRTVCLSQPYVSRSSITRLCLERRQLGRKAGKLRSHKIRSCWLLARRRCPVEPTSTRRRAIVLVQFSMVGACGFEASQLDRSQALRRSWCLRGNGLRSKVRLNLDICPARCLRVEDN
jgi:hypothetical protein